MPACPSSIFDIGPNIATTVVALIGMVASILAANAARKGVTILKNGSTVVTTQPTS
jgi:hypothetical protein